MLSGKVAGVSVTNDGGTPGAGSTIRIRGGSSLNASNNPFDCYRWCGYGPNWC